MTRETRKSMDWRKHRRLNEGEMVILGDWALADKWLLVDDERYCRPAPSPLYTSHVIYARPIRFWWPNAINKMFWESRKVQAIQIRYLKWKRNKNEQT